MSDLSTRDPELFRRIAQELPHGAVFVVDRDLRYVVAEGAELEAAGFCSADFVGRTVREAVPPPLADQHEADYRAVLGGGAFERTHEVNHRHYRSYGMPLTAPDGETEFALVVSYDVTHHVEHERHQDKVLAILGHELRNPLATLNIGLALLKRTNGAPPPPQTLELMERQVRQMNCMVDDLLGLAYLAHGRFELHRERVDVAELVQEVLAAMRPAASRKRQALLWRSPEVRLFVDADRGKLTQVLTNLVSNAVKYTPDGGAVTVSAEDGGTAIAIRVTDTGVGMEADAVAGLFELFARGVQHGLDAEHEEAGLGIGLWVAKQFAEAHGGQIAASSPGPGAGSVFTLTLPAVAAGHGNNLHG